LKGHFYIAAPGVLWAAHEICIIFWMFLTFGDLHRWPFEPKIGTLSTPADGKIYSDFVFLRLFVFELGACMLETHGQADGLPDKTCNAAY